MIDKNKQYISFFKEASRGATNSEIDALGEYGAYGFLSNDPYEAYQNIGEDIMMEINMSLMDMVDSGKPVGKALDALPDFRVDAKKFKGKFTIVYPMEIAKKKRLLNQYIVLTKMALSSYVSDIKEANSFFGKYEKEVRNVAKYANALDDARSSYVEALRRLRKLAQKEKREDILKAISEVESYRAIGDPWRKANAETDLEKLIKS